MSDVTAAWCKAIIITPAGSPPTPPQQPASTHAAPALPSPGLAQLAHTALRPRVLMTSIFMTFIVLIKDKMTCYTFVKVFL